MRRSYSLEIVCVKVTRNNAKQGCRLLDGRGRCIAEMLDDQLFMPLCTGDHWVFEEFRPR